MDFRFIEMDVPAGVKDQCYNQVSASRVVPVSVLKDWNVFPCTFSYRIAESIHVLPRVCCSVTRLRRAQRFWNHSGICTIVVQCPRHGQLSIPALPWDSGPAKGGRTQRYCSNCSHCHLKGSVTRLPKCFTGKLLEDLFLLFLLFHKQ